MERKGGGTKGLLDRRDLLGVTEQCIRVQDQAVTPMICATSVTFPRFPKTPSLAKPVSIRAIQGRRDLALSTAPEPSAVRTVTLPGNRHVTRISSCLGIVDQALKLRQSLY